MKLTEETARKLALALGAGAIALLAGCAGSQTTETGPADEPVLGTPDCAPLLLPPDVMDPCPPCGRG